MPQNCGVSKKSKIFQILVIYLLETWESHLKMEKLKNTGAGC